RKRRGGGDENRTSKSTRRRDPRLLHGLPSPPSGNEPTHHPQLLRQHSSATAVSCPRAEQAYYGAQTDRSGSTRYSRLPALPRAGTQQWRVHEKRSPLSHSRVLSLRSLP